MHELSNYPRNGTSSTLGVCRLQDKHTACATKCIIKVSMYWKYTECMHDTITLEETAVKQLLNLYKSYMAISYYAH